MFFPAVTDQLIEDALKKEEFETNVLDLSAEERMTLAMEVNAKLRTEMKVNAAKEKVSERKEAFDKAEQEEWILDLLAYAEGCYEMAYAWAEEAEYTMMQAAYEIDYYNERFMSKE